VARALLAAVALAFPQVAHTAGTPAGTVISNQATGTVGRERYFSNTVDTTVTTHCVPSVTPDGTPAAPGQRVGITPGGEAAVPYLLTNAGNDTFTFTLSWLLPAGGDFDLFETRVVRDGNGNGARDPGEPEVTDVTLPADGTAALLLVVTAPSSADGHAQISLTATCPDGRTDHDNTADVRTAPGPNLQLAQSITPTAVLPGGAAGVTLHATNTGQGATTAPVTITNFLDVPALADFTFVPASATAPVGSIEYTTDGHTWQPDASGTVKGLRWTVPHLDVGQKVNLTFRVVARAGAPAGPRENTATLTGADTNTPLVTRATLRVLPAPHVVIGPFGNPSALPGGEASADDAQVRSGAVVGQLVCYAQSVQNLGNVDDVISIDATVTRGAAALTVQRPDGTPMPASFALAASERIDLRACLTPTAVASSASMRPTALPTITATLTTRSAMGATPNSTSLTLTGVSDHMPTLTKTVTPAGTVAQGDTLTYTLTFGNPYDFPLTNVHAQDTLAPTLTFVSATHGGTHDAFTRTVHWTAGTLAPGETRTVTLVTRVATGTPDDSVIRNTFALDSAEVTNPVQSAAVTTPVFSALLTLHKTVLVPDAYVGDTVTYQLRVRNTSATATLQDLTITDHLPAGLEYVPGSSVLNAAPTPDPAWTGRDGTWTLGMLGPNGEAILTFRVRVTPHAPTDLVNSADARAVGAAGHAAVAAATARARLTVRPGVFGTLGDIVGRVYVDVNADGRYTDGTDEPVARARVLLSNGRSVLTDAGGRYHFGSVPWGVWALRLAPLSTPHEPRPHPADAGLPGTRSVNVQGLVSADFPLLPLAAHATLTTATRSVTLHAGDVTVEKSVTRDGSAYVVRFVITTVTATSDFHLTDPLPVGAVLVSGTATLGPATLPPGVTVLEYRFAWNGPDAGAVTDPSVTWRAP